MLFRVICSLGCILAIVLLQVFCVSAAAETIDVFDASPTSGDPWSHPPGDPGDPGGDPEDPGSDPGDPGEEPQDPWDDPNAPWYHPDDPWGGDDYHTWIDHYAPESLGSWEQGDFGDKYDYYSQQVGVYIRSEIVVEDGTLKYDRIYGYVKGDDGFVYVTHVEDGVYKGTYRYPAPEPSSWSLLAVGALVLAVVYRFHKGRKGTGGGTIL